MDNTNPKGNTDQLDFLPQLEESNQELCDDKAFVDLTGCMISHGIFHDKSRGLYYGRDGLFEFCPPYGGSQS